ncbi:MAG: ATP-binding cassette domain-containing protein [Candidatus Micrarchaeota archaeon]|nr:ATP-binding cassette domain-containing protein [Candidatus Micrarchaeota archaeon]
MGMIEIKNLTKKFDSFVAVDNISLSIKEGEIFGILGPNGAGKTTTINMILGLLHPTGGAITINGMDNIRHSKEVKSLVGLMTQETVVESDLTARENLVLFAELYHVPPDEIEKRVKRALQDSDLVAFADKRAGTFSGGMQRRLALVKAMIQEPKIIILDEPTTGLDIQNRVSMWSRIKELSKKGITVVMTTQYLEEADALCDRIAIIDHGKIRAIGTTTELKKFVGTGRVLEIISGDASKANAIVELLKKEFKLEATIKVDKITTVIAEQGDAILPKILNSLDKKGLTVASVSLHLPTLDDVFIKLTGSGLRDTSDDNAVSARTALWSRMR